MTPFDIAKVIATVLCSSLGAWLLTQWRDITAFVVGWWNAERDAKQQASAEKYIADTQKEKDYLGKAWKRMEMVEKERDNIRERWLNVKQEFMEKEADLRREEAKSRRLENRVEVLESKIETLQDEATD